MGSCRKTSWKEKNTKFGGFSILRNRRPAMTCVITRIGKYLITNVFGRKTLLQLRKTAEDYLDTKFQNRSVGSVFSGYWLHLSTYPVYYCLFKTEASQNIFWSSTTRWFVVLPKTLVYWVSSCFPLLLISCSRLRPERWVGENRWKLDG